MRLELPSRIDFAGGLNTKQNLFVSENEAVVARNVDIGTDGVYKRQGTVRLVTESVGQTIASHFFYSNTGVRLLAVVVNTSVRIYGVSAAGTLTLLRNIANVYAQVPIDVTFTILPGKDISILLLCKNQTAVQVTLYEFYTQTHVADEARFADYIEWISVDSTTKRSVTSVFVDGEVSTSLITAAGTYAAITDARVNLPTFKGASLIAFAVSAWAEADAWRGDNFITSVPRLHASNTDATVELPSSVLEDVMYYTNEYFDLPSKTAPYNRLRIQPAPVGFSTFTPTDVLNYVPVDAETLPVNMAQELSYRRYAFTDGIVTDTLARFTSNVVKLGDVSPGDTHVTFGNARPYLQYSLSSASNVGSNSFVLVPEHQFQTGDVVRVTVATGDGYLTTNTSAPRRYVKRLDSNRFELYTDEALTTLDTTSLQAQLRIPIVSTSAAGGATQDLRLIVPASLKLPGTVIPITYAPQFGNSLNIPFGTYYLQFVGSASPTEGFYQVFTDAACRFGVTGMLNPIQGNGGVICVLQTFKIERLVQDNLYVARQRFVPFNSFVGCAPTNIGIIRNNVYGSNFTEFATTSLDGRTTGYSLFWSEVRPAEPTPLLSAASSSLARAYYIQSSSANNANDWQIIYNKERKWISNSFSGNVRSKRPAKANWSDIDFTLIPIAGYGRFASFRDGVFPNIGVVYNGRLVLAGVNSNPNLLLFSSPVDVFGLGYDYSYMQVYKGQDSTNDANPFDLSVKDLENAPVTALHVWQDKLFVFTNRRSYQVEATSPSNRSIKVLAGSGAFNVHCVANSDRLLYFASNAGVYAVSLLDSLEYRTGEVSAKVSDVITDALGNANVNAFLCYNSTDDVLTLGIDETLYRYNARYDNWVTYDTTLGFNLRYLCVADKWLIGVTANKLGTILWRSNYDAYADFVVAVTDVTSVTVRAGTQQFNVVAGRKFYKVPWRMASTLVPNDIRVWLDNTEIFDNRWRKVSDTTIELLDNNITSGVLTVTPTGYTGDWFGVVTLLNGYQEAASYGLLVNLNPAATYTANLLTTPMGIAYDNAGYTLGDAPLDRVEVGHMYIAEYQSGVLGTELFDITKRCQSVSVLLALDEYRNLYDEVIPQMLLSLPDSEVINYKTYRTPHVGVFVAVRVVGSRESVGNLFSTLEVDTYADEYVLYRDRPNITGYMFSICVVSVNARAFKLVAWGADIDALKGTGQVSGGR